MAALPEADEFPAEIYQLEDADPVKGGMPNEATGDGMDNIPHAQLARRTRWLKTRVDQLLGVVVAATTSVAGIVKLTNSVTSDSTTTAATAAAAKAANDNANTRALASRTITGGGLATGGGDATANRTITVPVATQAQAEAGEDGATAMTPLRTAQAIAADRARYGVYYGPSAGVNINALPAGFRGLVNDGNSGTWPLPAAGRFWWVQDEAMYSGARVQRAVRYQSTGSNEVEEYRRVRSEAGTWGQWSAVVTTSTLLAQMASVSSGGVLGCYALCRNDGANLLTSSTVAGSSLTFAGVPIGSGGATPAGTWRCMSNCLSGSVGLFMRIS